MITAKAQAPYAAQSQDEIIAYQANLIRELENRNTDLLLTKNAHIIILPKNWTGE